MALKMKYLNSLYKKERNQRKKNVQYRPLLRDQFGGNVRRLKVRSAHFSKSYGTFSYSLQRQPSSIVCCRSLFLLHWVLIQQADVRFVTGCITQRRVVLSVANISKNEANDPSNESIWREKKQQNQKQVTRERAARSDNCKEKPFGRRESI